MASESQKVGNMDEDENVMSSGVYDIENDGNSEGESSNSSEDVDDENKGDQDMNDEDSENDTKFDDDSGEGEVEDTASEQDVQEAIEVDEAEGMEIEDDDDDVNASATSGEMEAVGLPSNQVAISPRRGLSLKRPSLSTSSSGSKKTHPKIRIKLTLKLPTQANAKKKLPITVSKSENHAPQESEDDDDEEEVKAMVVDSDEVVDAVAVPTSPMFAPKRESNSKPKLFKKSLPISKAATGTASKRRSFLPSKQIRLPPITSPGLLMLRPPPGSSQGPKQAASATALLTGSGILTPQKVFDAIMSNAGYTYEQRAKHPHRGSSVQRTIGDIFDTNVKLSLHKVELVPKDLWLGTIADEGHDRELLTLPQILIQCLEESKQKELRRNSNGDSSRKRRRYAPCRLRDMVPVSLTVPYPDAYIQKRLDYVEDVQSRENAIVQWQAAQEELEIAREEYEHRDLNGADSDAAGSVIGGARPSFTNPVTIPPIPEPPEPPRQQDLVAPPEANDNVSRSTSTSVPTFYYLDNGGTSPDSLHPIYLPNGKEDFVAHLDRNCFHITDGRYFGLQTNCIADPNFVGPNAPGLAAVSASGSGGGLATATTSTTTSTSGLTGGGMTMILSASFHSAAAIPPNKDESTSATKVKPSIITKHDSSGDGSSKEKIARPSPKSSTSPSSDTGEAGKLVPLEKTELISIDKPQEGVFFATSSSNSDLRKIMEDETNTALAETFKDWIIRAAVYSGLTQRKDHSFRGPNGETYPDIGKAFALYSGVKPCERCKNNKQGVS